MVFICDFLFCLSHIFRINGILEKKDPSKYDFTPEWKSFWTKRMLELKDESFEKKKEEIRKNLNLPKDGRERTNELKEKYNIKAVPRKEISDSLESASTSSSLRRDKLEKPHRYERSGSREKVTKSTDSYKRYEREKSYERERSERERLEIDRRERDRHHRPSSRGSYHDDSPPSSSRYGRDEREPVDYYKHNPYKWHPGQSKSAYYNKSHYYREMPITSLPKYEEPIEEEPENDVPLTVVTVLRLLSALEELLGPSLGPKIVELLAKALALEKVKANAADELLLNEDNCVLFETIKEKLKGLLMNDMIEKHQIKAVKRAIKNIAGVIHMASEKEKNKTPEEKQQEALLKQNLAAEKSEKTIPESKQSKTPEEEKQEIAKKLAAALVAQGKTDVSKEDLENLVEYYYNQRKAKENASQPQNETDNTPSTSHAATASSTKQTDVPLSSEPSIDLTDDNSDVKKEQDEGFDLPSSNALENLTDADLQTLLQNFEDLSTEEQQHLHTYMKKLEASDPARVEKLRKYVNVAFDLPANEQNKRIDRRSSERSNHTESQFEFRTKQNSDPYDDMFYDDTKDSNKKVTSIVDSDDDDYSYDDLCKAASKNVKDKQKELERKQRSPEVISDSDSVNKHDQFILDSDRNFQHYDDSNASRASGENSNPRTTLNDTETIIANLMGSLQKNVQSRGFSDRIQMDSTNEKQRHLIQSNVPFYLQQQSQNSYNHPKSSNHGYANEFNLGGQNQQFSSSNHFDNAYANQSQNYGSSQRLNIPLNIPTYQQQQQQVQPPQLTNQQAALLAQLNQQQNRRSAW